MEKLGQNEIYSQLLGQHPILRTYKGDELINEYTPLYTPPLDWRDIRSDCPNNSIALYAAHGRINNPNYNIKKVTGAVKYTVVGNPTIIDGIASNFSTSNYLRTSSNWAQINTKFDIVICARPSGGSALMCIGSGESGKMKLYFSTSKITFQTGNSSQDDLVIETTFSNNLFYYIRIKRNESTTFLSYSTDGTNWQSEISGNLVYTSQSNFMRFGYNANIPSTFGGSIDLNQTYVKVNNEMWFGSQMQLISANPNIYLQTTGTQYINTGIIPDSDTSLEVCASNFDMVGNNEWLFGSRTSYLNASFGLYSGGSNYIDTWGGQTTSSSSFDLSNKSIVLKDTTKTYVDGTQQFSYNSETWTGTYPMFLFCLNNGGNRAGIYSGTKIYYSKTTKSTLQQHLVPVPQGLVIGNFTCPSNGMFDIVEQKFYGNQGTGDFIYGNDSSETITYNNLGFTATCTGGYKVFIDGNQYGGIRTSGSQCNIIWSQSGINTGNNIITPSALKAHKIWIEPATEGNNITVFNCSRVADSGYEEQGVLWIHFNIENSIAIGWLLNKYNYYKNWLTTAITAKNNILKGDVYFTFYDCKSLEYVPLIDGSNISSAAENFFAGCEKLPKITLKNINIKQYTPACFNNCKVLKQIKFKNVSVTGTNINNFFKNCYALTQLPDFVNWTNVTSAKDFLTEATNLSDTVIDASAARGLKAIGCHGSSTNFMSGLKGLRVSSQAPFNDGTAPQINVSYTGMDRDALVQLFNDLPTVTGGQVINVTGCTGNQNKLTIVGSPIIQDSVVNGFSSSNYLELPSWKDEGNDIDMAISFMLPDSYPNYSRALNSFGNSANNTSYFSILAYKGGLAFRINNNESISINYSLQNNILYKARLTRISGTYTLFLLDENETVLGTSSLQSSFLLANGESAIMKIGYENRILGAEFPGNIYLDNTYIKVNNELWFGREQYLLPEDKAIATNKGWTLTL